MTKTNFRDLSTTTRKTFKPIKEKFNGLNLAKVVGVKVEPFEYDEDSKSVFAGKKANRLVVHFEGIVPKTDEIPYFGYSIFPYVPGGDAEKYYLETDLQKVKHL